MSYISICCDTNPVVSFCDRGPHIKHKRHSCVSANPTDPVSNTRLLFLSVKMQNEKVKHRPSAKYLYFYEITGPILIFLEKNRKIKKVPTYRQKKKKFSMLAETQLFFFFFYALWSNDIITSQTSLWCIHSSQNTIKVILKRKPYWFSSLYTPYT